MTTSQHIYEVRPRKEPGVQPVFRRNKMQSTTLRGRASFRSGQIRILDSSGNVECVIPFDDTDRKL